MQPTFPDLTSTSKLFIHQRHELFELLGYETRNKYEIVNASGTPVAYAAEQGRGILTALFRIFLGHWRSFEIHFFNSQRQEVLIAKHPFRFIFQCLEIYSAQNEYLGRVQQRWALFHKRFDVLGKNDVLVFKIASPFWRIWTFKYMRRDRECAVVQKKWSGGLSEIFTDKDNFLIEYKAQDLTQEERLLILSSGLFIDLQYFERKAN